MTVRVHGKPDFRVTQNLHHYSRRNKAPGRALDCFAKDRRDVLLDRPSLASRSPDQRIHRREEIRSLERLADNGIGLRGNLRRIRICAEHEDRHKSCSTVGSQVLDQLLSSHDRHHQVGHHQIGQGIAHLSYRVATVLSLIHLVSAILQNQPQELPFNGNVVHDQYPFLHLLWTWCAAGIKLADRRGRLTFTGGGRASAKADGLTHAWDSSKPLSRSSRKSDRLRLSQHAKRDRSVSLRTDIPLCLPSVQLRHFERDPEPAGDAPTSPPPTPQQGRKTARPGSAFWLRLTTCSAIRAFEVWA
jgi:hypothetical protein